MKNIVCVILIILAAKLLTGCNIIEQPPIIDENTTVSFSDINNEVYNDALIEDYPNVLEFSTDKDIYNIDFESIIVTLTNSSTDQHILIRPHTSPVTIKMNVDNVWSDIYTTGAVWDSLIQLKEGETQEYIINNKLVKEVEYGYFATYIDKLSPGIYRAGTLVDVLLVTRKQQGVVAEWETLWQGMVWSEFSVTA